MTCNPTDVAYYTEFHKAGMPRVTLIAFWPTQECPGKMAKYEDKYLSCTYYRVACAGTNMDLQIVEHPEFILLPMNTPVISMEEPREGVASYDLKNFEHPRDATYLIGNSEYQFPSDYVNCEGIITIKVPDLEYAEYAPFYGPQAAAILWYDRNLKGL
jgi:hypothetical protein